MITPATIKARFPEFATIPDDTIQMYIDDSVPDFNVPLWGNMLDQGQSYFVASMLFTNVVNTLNMASTAPIQNKSAGNASVGYAQTAVDYNDTDMLHYSNKYGQRYLQLRRLLGTAVATTATAELDVTFVWPVQ